MKNIITLTHWKLSRLMVFLFIGIGITGFKSTENSVDALLKKQNKTPDTKACAIFAVFPNDCVNCIYNFHTQIKKLQNSKNVQTFVVFRNRRTIEKKQLLQEQFPDIDTLRTIVIWNDFLSDDIIKTGAIKGKGSVMLLYDRKGNPLLKKLVREINGTEKELNEILN